MSFNETHQEEILGVILENFDLDLLTSVDLTRFSFRPIGKEYVAICTAISPKDSAPCSHTDLSLLSCGAFWDGMFSVEASVKGKGTLDHTK